MVSYGVRGDARAIVYNRKERGIDVCPHHIRVRMKCDFLPLNCYNRLREKKHGIKAFFESGKCSQAIRKGLIFMTPLVILSSLVQVALNFPISAYRTGSSVHPSVFFIRYLQGFTAQR